MLDATTKLPLKDPALFRQANYIAGAWVQADSGKTIAVRNPATGEVIGEVPAMSQAETRRAIEAANAAWPAWRAMLAKDRAVILHKIAALMHENSDDLAAIMTAEQGKPLAEAHRAIAPRPLAMRADNIFATHAQGTGAGMIGNGQMAEGLGKGVLRIAAHAKPGAVIITRHEIGEIRDRGGHVQLRITHGHQDARGQGFGG